MPMPKVSRLEVVSTGARRRWILEEKRRIVTESYGGPRLVSVTARRNGLSTSQLFTWRRLAREGKLSGDAAPVLVPVEITPAALPVSSATTSVFELGGGCRVRVDRALQRFLSF